MIKIELMQIDLKWDILNGIKLSLSQFNLVGMIFFEINWVVINQIISNRIKLK